MGAATAATASVPWVVRAATSAATSAADVPPAPLLVRFSLDELAIVQFNAAIMRWLKRAGAKRIACARQGSGDHVRPSNSLNNRVGVGKREKAGLRLD